MKETANEEKKFAKIINKPFADALTQHCWNKELYGVDFTVDEKIYGFNFDEIEQLADWPPLPEKDRSELKRLYPDVTPVYTVMDFVNGGEKRISNLEEFKDYYKGLRDLIENNRESRANEIVLKTIKPTEELPKFKRGDRVKPSEKFKCDSRFVWDAKKVEAGETDYKIDVDFKTGSKVWTPAWEISCVIDSILDNPHAYIIKILIDGKICKFFCEEQEIELYKAVERK